MSDPKPRYWSVGSRDLSPEQCKSRYSLAFMNALCAQAGVTIGETRQDEDVHAIDMAVNFTEAPVQVQLKCSSAKTMSGPFERIDLEERWIEKWAMSQLPVFLVLVVVPDDRADWLSDNERSTLHRAHAYWMSSPEFC
ncbi:DUF4365 domain-containing protein [Rhodococcus sp. PAE-6]|uniref:DUF4365 domain-containing protein n=1 Tax=Rhodococcus sp. PAE-6 TaxID=2972477 RepID=UPI0021B29539|nr:DUF4365 domain-containing protein [Rhodococcus sp. PAE-6]MCT7294316.1 DUF4365 domain-containing protein [Rhodococcus sp. PAE-6]